MGRSPIPDRPSHCPEARPLYPETAALLDYPWSLESPKPAKGSFDRAAAARGRAVFRHQARWATCHRGPAFTDVLNGPVVPVFTRRLKLAASRRMPSGAQPRNIEPHLFGRSGSTLPYFTTAAPQISLPSSNTTTPCSRSITHQRKRPISSSFSSRSSVHGGRRALTCGSA